MEIITILLILDAFLALAIIFLERRRPDNVIFWVMVLFFLPEVGFILYLIFGRRPQRWSRRALRLEERDREFVNSITEGTLSFRPDKVEKGGGALEEMGSLISMLENGGAALAGGNSVRVITSGSEKYKLLFEDIRRARHHIHLEYFVFRDDEVGRELLSLLISRAEEGVKVRLLIDDVGGRPSQMMLLDLKAKGGEYARFYPSHVPVLRWLNLNINYRNHRKIVVIDGRIAYTGGFNIGDEYLGKDPKLGRWRDTHVRIEGQAVRSLQLRFLLDWRYASSQEVSMGQEFFPPLDERGNAAIQVVSSGPTERTDQIKEAYLRLIASAKRSVLIQTPYFVPDKSVMDMLRVAARSGVDVRIMVPRRKDQMLVHWVSQSFIGELLLAGVRAYYYEDGFLHSKTITVDGSVTSIGSANWDIRAFALNFETNAVIYGRLGAEHERIFFEDVRSCTELTKEAYDRRSLSEKVKESIFRLASPVL